MPLALKLALPLTSTLATALTTCAGVTSLRSCSRHDKPGQEWLNRRYAGQGLGVSSLSWAMSRYMTDAGSSVHDRNSAREPMSLLDRRTLVRNLAAIGVAATLPPVARAQPGRLLTKPIPSSGEALPLVGLGSWITFNVGDDPVARDVCAEVMRAFFVAGGRMIDSSPMYGSSQRVIGYGLARLDHPAGLFSADKVWVSSGARGPAQIEASRHAWGVQRFDLLQVHNLLSWEQHLRTLLTMKAVGQLRYVGITTSEGRRHGEFERIMRVQPLDFVQVTYNIFDREVEARILALARDRGMAVIVNRAFQQGDLIRKLERHPLPGWAGRDRLRHMGAVRLEVHYLAPGGDLCHPGDHAGRSRAGEPRCRRRADAGRGDAGAHDRACREALMSEWWSYSLSDLLMFSPRTYYRLFKLYNDVVWPWHVAGIALGLVVLALWLGGVSWRGRAVAAALACCWLWVAWAYLYSRYDTINWAARYFAVGFAIEAALLVWSGLVRDRLRLRRGWDLATVAGLGLFGLALVVWPGRDTRC